MNYERAQSYINKFDFIREFFAEDEQVQEERIKEERDTETFRNMCVRYNKEVAIIEKVIEVQPFGLLQLTMSNFKSTALPEPTRLITSLQHNLPCIGKTEIDKLIEDSEEMEKKLNEQPVKTVEYVHYLEYIDAANNKINDMENMLDYCKELYDIMEEFQVPVATEDMSNYLGVSVTMGSLRNLIDRKTEEITKIVKAFNDQMNKDISTLIGEVGTIKDQCMQPWLCDIESNIAEVTAFLHDLHLRLGDCQKRANEFKNYQKQFRVSISSDWRIKY